MDKAIEQADQKKEEYELGIAKYEKELKAIVEVQKYWKNLADKNKTQSNEKVEDEKKQLRELQQMIALKKEELKDFQRNVDLSAKIKLNIGNDQVQKALLLGTGPKDSKKKKK